MNLFKLSRNGGYAKILQNIWMFSIMLSNWEAEEHK